MDVVVAIEVPPPQKRLTGALVPPSTLHYAGTPEKFQQASVGAISRPRTARHAFSFN
jgi:hypothetical protein